MKKKILKFVIIFSLTFGISNSKVSAQNSTGLGKLFDFAGQSSNKISGEKLEKLLIENYILVESITVGLYKGEWKFNKDKTYSTNPPYPYNDGPKSGVWKIDCLGNWCIKLADNSNVQFQFAFGEDGHIYVNQANSNGWVKEYSYKLNNVQEKLNREAKIAEEKRIAEELRLKKIEEEKRQLAIKREQERIKQEEEKKRAQAEYELAVKKDKERREEQERKELYENILKYSLLGSFLLIISFLLYKYKLKIKNLYLEYNKFIEKEKKIRTQYKKNIFMFKCKKCTNPSPSLVSWKLKDIIIFLVTSFLFSIKCPKCNQYTPSTSMFMITIIEVFFVVIVLLVISLSGNKSSTSNQNYSTSNEVSDEKFRRYIELRTAVKRECDNKWYTRGLSTIAADVERMCRNNMYDVHSKTFIGETSEVKRRLREYGVYE